MAGTALSVTLDGDYTRVHDEDDPREERKEGEAQADVLQTPAAEELPIPSGDEAEEILTRARQRYDDWWERDKENRDEAVKDKKFCFVPGEQWDKDTRENERKGRVCLEVNQLPQFVNQVVNDLRQNRAGIRVTPEGGGDEASIKEAQRRQDIIRGIEYESRADAVYDAGGADAVVGGSGWWRVLTEYKGDRSFDQVIVIRPIADFSCVVADPYYQQPDGSDRCGAFVTETVSKAAFEDAWPDAGPIDWSSEKVADNKWFDGAERIVIADYYERVRVTRTLVMLTDGTVYVEGVDDPPMLPPGVKVARTRAFDDWKIRWFKLAGGQQILAEYAWKGGTIIPVVQCVGNEAVIEGKRRTWGLIRFARDPQRMYNFAISTTAESVALTPKSPFMVAEGQDEGYEEEYELANRRNYSVLHYKPTSHDGHLVPMPQRNMPAQVPTGLVEMLNLSRGDLRSSIGLYDPSLGQRSNETSGVAIQRRENQGDVATFNFPDNQARAIALTGRIVNELLPHYYDGENRQVPAVAENGKVRAERINVPIPAAPPGQVANGFNANARFTVRVEAGPSYTTKRQESRESMMAFIQAFPPSAPILAPKVAKDMDWDGAEDVGDELEALLPPPVQAVLQQKRAQREGQAAIPPEVQAQMQQMQQQMQQMQQGMQQLQAENQQLQAGAAEKQAKIQADAQIAQQKQADEHEARLAEAQTRQAEAEAAAAEAVRIAEIKANAEAQAKIRAAEIAAAADVQIAQIKAASQPVSMADGGAMAAPAGGAVPEAADKQDGLLALAEAVAQMAQALSKPKTLVRGPDGRAIGIQ